MLVSAAAATWKVDPAECNVQDSVVWHGKRSSSFGELAKKAAALPVPDPATVKLKDRKDWRLLGKAYTGVDNHKVVAGAPLFGIDQQLPGMKIAVYEKCPAVGGRVRAANLDEVKKLPGVRDAFVIEGNGKTTEVMPGVAIVADDTWAALKAQKALRVDWDESNASKDSWRDFTARAKALSAKPAGDKVLGTTGTPEVVAQDRGAQGRRVLHLPVRFSCAARTSELHGVEPRWHRRVLVSDTDCRSRARDGGRRARRAGGKDQDQPDASGRRLRPATHERLHVRSRRDRPAVSPDR